MRDVLLNGLRVAGTGTAIGLGLALIFSRLLESFVFEVRTTDPWVLTVAAGMSLGVALLAAYLPAWRASRANPMDALSTD